MKLSVVIPTYNRLDRLREVVRALERQDHPLQAFEVIVVSDGASDGTNEYLRTLRTPLALRPVLQKNQGVAVARNSGVQEARGDLLLFLDDDVVPAPQLISEHLRTHEAYQAAHDDRVVVLGPMLTPPDFEMQPWVSWEQQMLMKQYEDMVEGRWEPTARQFYTGNTSLARHHVLQAGGFDPSFRRAEDVELAYRLADAGLYFVFNPDAIGHHFAARSFESWLATPYAYGRNDVIFTRDKGQEWLLPTIFYEFQGRNRLIKEIVRLCLDRPWLSRPLTGMLSRFARLGDRLSIESLPRIAYSGIFNLRHYQGVADELGGREQFFRGVQETVREPVVAGEPDPTTQNGLTGESTHAP